MGYMIIVGVVSIVGAFVQRRLKSKFKFYSQHRLNNGMSGKDIAEKMLADNGLYDVQVLPSNGFLSDHYNPKNKTVNLSPDVYQGNSVAAAAVAAHECGHAVQHATAYPMLQFRSNMVPIVKVASMMQKWILMIGFALFASMNNPMLLMVVVGVFAVTCLFSVITLPVEYDASNRALAWLDAGGSYELTEQEHEGAKDALKWAARTYLVAALGALAQLLYFWMMMNNRRN